MPLPNSALLEILYTAANHPLGLSVTSPDPLRLRQELYKARRLSDPDPLLDALTIRVAPTNPAGELWIIRGGTANAPTAKPNGAHP